MQGAMEAAWRAEGRLARLFGDGKPQARVSLAAGSTAAPSRRHAHTALQHRPAAHAAAPRPAPVLPASSRRPRAACAASTPCGRSTSARRSSAASTRAGTSPRRRPSPSEMQGESHALGPGGPALGPGAWAALGRAALGGLQRGPRSRLATRRSPRVLPWPPRVEPACSDWRLPYRPAPPVPPAGT